MGHGDHGQAEGRKWLYYQEKKISRGGAIVCLLYFYRFVGHLASSAFLLLLAFLHISGSGFYDGHE